LKAVHKAAFLFSGALVPSSLFRAMLQFTEQGNHRARTLAARMYLMLLIFFGAQRGFE
jgi:hypothetical protein